LISSGEGSKTAAFSWFPVAAYIVQLKEPVTKILESMIANLLCMCNFSLSSIVHSTPSRQSSQTSAPGNLAHSSSQMILTLTPAQCLFLTASARTLFVNAKMQISKVFIAELRTEPRAISFSFEGKNRPLSSSGFCQ